MKQFTNALFTLISNSYSLVCIESHEEVISPYDGKMEFLDLSFILDGRHKIKIGIVQCRRADIGKIHVSISNDNYQDNRWTYDRLTMSMSEICVAMIKDLEVGIPNLKYRTQDIDAWIR